MINFVSNIPQGLRSGGFSAMSAAAHAALAGEFPAHYVGPIDPPAGPWAKAVSKARRMTGGQGNFFFFAEPRLERIAQEVRRANRTDAVLDFSHGFTPWIRTRPERRYIAWSDCTFRDYVSIYHRREQFAPRDLLRIEGAEARWLAGAEQVLFTSRWAADRAISDYGLAAARVGVVGIFGEMELPEKDAYSGGSDFAFISTDFAGKGGDVVLTAFARLRAIRPEIRLVIAGASPGNYLPAGVEYLGFLRKEEPDEALRLRSLMASARALVLPTRSDISPLLTVEAAYFGCPVVASKAFAIPELVQDGVSGVLLDDPGNPQQVARAMLEMLKPGAAYAAMRKAAWTAGRRLTKEAFRTRLTDAVRAALPAPRGAAA